MTDTVTVIWTDASGTYTNAFTIENPTLDEVKAGQKNPVMMAPVAREEGAAEPTDAEIYQMLSTNMVNQVMYQAQNNKTQQAMNLIPPVSIKPVEPPA